MHTEQNNDIMIHNKEKEYIIIHTGEYNNTY
jgi:hypothetical protein